MSRARGPQRPSVDQRGREVGELGGAVVRKMVSEPLVVGHAVCAAGDDAEVLVAEPHDREVGLEAAARREPRRVDHAADAASTWRIDTCCSASSAPGPDDVEDRERRQVEDPGAVAHREVLGIDDRRPPARVPLGLAAPDPVAVLLEQRSVRLVPLRPLPPGGLEEDSAELLLTLVVRREAHVAVRAPLLERVDDPVRLVEALGRAGLHVRRCLLVLPEARSVGGVKVDVRLAVHHPLGERLADAGTFLHPDGGADQRPSTSGARRGSASRRA